MPKSYVRSGLHTVAIAKALEEALEIIIPKTEDNEGVARYIDLEMTDVKLALQLNEKLGTKLSDGHIAYVRKGLFGQLPRVVQAVPSKDAALAKINERLDAIEGILLEASVPDPGTPSAIEAVKSLRSQVEKYLNDYGHELIELKKEVTALKTIGPTADNAIIHKAMGEIRHTQAAEGAALKQLGEQVNTIVKRMAEIEGEGGDINRLRDKFRVTPRGKR